EVRAGVARLCEPAEDPLAVSVEVADGGVDLREGEPHAPIIQVCDSRAKTLRIPRTRSHAARAARSTRVAHPAPPRPPPPYPTLWVGSRGPPTTRYRLYPGNRYVSVPTSCRFRVNLVRRGRPGAVR